MGEDLIAMKSGCLKLLLGIEKICICYSILLFLQILPIILTNLTRYSE